MGGSKGGFFKESKPAKFFRDPKKFLNKQFNPTTPHDPGVPEAPEFDAQKEALLKEALISRLRSDFQRGPGRQATIATSAAGVTKRTKVIKRKLAGVS